MLMKLVNAKDSTNYAQARAKLETTKQTQVSLQLETSNRSDELSQLMHT